MTIRIRSLIGALTAASALLSLATPAAWARQHPSPDGPCRVNVNVAPRLIQAGESVLVFGRLRCGAANPGAAAGATVQLMQRTAGAPEPRLAQTTTTDAGGFYEMVVPGIEHTSALLVGSHEAASATKIVRVLAHVTLQGPADGLQLFTGPAMFTFSGTVTPKDAGARVFLQRQNANTSNEWHRIDVGRVGQDGDYSLTHTFLLAGEANIRVLVRSQRGSPPSASEARSYVISQAQNPQLTINASADPISVGQHVTISGRVARAPLTAVTLLAHAAGHPGFAPVAEVKTDAGGRYRFPAQAPFVNTYYEVRSAARLSAELYEGVKDVLTAQVSATTIQAGQALTFSGIVAPNYAGHVIYLERQYHNSAGGFHVVQFGFVGPGSTYTLVHTVFDPGTSVLRVKIPGGPENAGAASPLFTIQVTPAPASALAPEAPGNATQPPEGQS